MLNEGNLVPTPGFVRALISASEERRTRTPTEALPFVDLALAASTRLGQPLSSLAVHLRGLVQRERANVLRVLGDFQSALSALERAEGAFQHLVGVDEDRGKPGLHQSYRLRCNRAA